LSKRHRWQSREEHIHCEVFEVRIESVGPYPSTQTISVMGDHGSPWNMDRLYEAPQSEFQCLELLDQEMQGEGIGRTILTHIVSRFIVREVEHHHPSKLVEYYLLPFEVLHHGSKLPPVGSEAV
jgi:hypothetical protein